MFVCGCGCVLCMCAYVCVRVCVCISCVCVCMCVCVHEHVFQDAHVSVFLHQCFGWAQVSIDQAQEATTGTTGLICPLAIVP